MLRSVYAHRKVPWLSRTWTTGAARRRRQLGVAPRPTAHCAPAGFVAGYRRRPADPGLDLIDRADAGQQVVGERCWLSCMNIAYFAPEMGPEGNFGDTVGCLAIVVAGIVIGLQVASKACKLGLWISPSSIGRELVPDKQWAGGSTAANIDRIDPEPCRGCLAATWMKDRYGFVGMDLRCLQAFAANTADDGIEESRGLADPACKSRPVDLDPLCCHHLGLAEQRQVMIELKNDDVGKRSIRCLAARDRFDRRLLARSSRLRTY